MAETTEKSNRVKYKFGVDELDLQNYIENIRRNADSYLTYKNWNEGQKEEFKRAYNKILSTLEDLLKTNNAGNFRTDEFGTIAGDQGGFGNKDNDDIDPVGSEYYYDNSGNRITTDDYNRLKDKDKRNYSTFSANQEVAKYFNTIGKAILNSGNKQTTSTSNPFNLGKNGFERWWTTGENPAGGNFDYAPYIEKDQLDENGVRGTSERSKYLSEKLLEYLDNLEDYDYSKSAYKDKDSYTEAIRDAIKNLNNGYDSEDTIALRRAGLSNAFLNNFFATGKPKTEVEEAKEYIEQREQEEKDEATLEEAEKLRQEEVRDDFFKDYIEKHSIDLNITPIKILKPNYNNDRVAKIATDKFGKDTSSEEALTKSMQNAIRLYINFGDLSKYMRGTHVPIIKGKKVTDKNIINQLIANRLDLAREYDLYLDPRYLKEDGTSILSDGYYVIPDSENTNDWTFLAYNPTTQLYYKQSMLLNDEIKKRMAYRLYKPVTKNKKGGIIKAKLGTAAIEYIRKVYLDALNKRLEEAEIKLKVKETDKPEERVRAGYRKPSESGWTAAENARIASAIMDIGSIIASFVPGYGTVASAGLGLASTGANFFADLNDDSLSGWDVAKNAGLGLAMDVAGIIPGLGAVSKTGKVARTLRALAPTAIAIWGAYQNGGAPIEAMNKLMDGKDLTVSDWKALVDGLSMLAGGAGYMRGRKAIKSATSLRDVADIKTDTGNMATISREDFDKLREIKGFLEQDKMFSDLTDGQHLQREFKNRELKPKFWKSRLRSLHPDYKTRTEYTLLPEDNSWDASLLKWLNPAKSSLKPSTKKNTSESKPTTSTTDIVLYKSPSKKFESSDYFKGKPFYAYDSNAAIVNKKAAKLRADMANKRQEAIKNIDDTKSPLTKKTERAVAANAGNVRTQQLREIANKVKSLQVPELPKEPLKGKAHKEVSEMYNLLFGTQPYELSENRFVKFVNKGIQTRDKIKTIEFWKKNYPKRFQGKTDNEVWQIIQEQQLLSKKKEGGTLDLNKVRKYLNGPGKNGIVYTDKSKKNIKNVTSTADWHDDVLLNKENDALRRWIDSFTLDNYDVFNKFQLSYADNLKNTKYVAGLTRAADFDQGVWDRQGLWDKANDVNSIIELLVKEGKIVRAGVTGDNATSGYLDGRFGGQEFLRHGGTRESWIGREEDLAKFQEALKEKGMTYTLDDKSGMYLYGKLPETPVDKEVTKAIMKPTNPNERTYISPEGEETKPYKAEDQWWYLKKDNIFDNPTLKFGLPRAIAGDMVNRRLRDMALEDLTPLSKQSPQDFRLITSHLRSENQGHRAAGDFRHEASRAFTSDASLYKAAQNQAEVQALKAIAEGNAKSDEMLRQTSELAWQQEKENHANRHNDANYNRALQWATALDKSKVKQGYLSSKWLKIWDPFWQQIEYDFRTKLAREQAKREALENNLIYSNASKAATYDLAKYAPELSKEALNVWNQVVSGSITPSLLYKDDPTKYQLYQLAQIALEQAMLDLLRLHYGLDPSPFGRVRQLTPFTSFKPFIVKKGGVLSAKKDAQLAIAGIKARTADAERFLKQIKECMDRHEKALNRLSKSMYGFIKASTLK